MYCRLLMLKNEETLLMNREFSGSSTFVSGIDLGRLVLPQRVELCVLVYKTSPQHRRGQGAFVWWGRGDSNPHGLNHRILSPMCLPIPPLPRFALIYSLSDYFQSGSDSTDMCSLRHSSPFALLANLASSFARQAIVDHP